LTSPQSTLSCRLTCQTDKHLFLYNPLGDGHETLEQRLTALRALNAGAANQMENLLAHPVRIEPSEDDQGYFDDFSYEAMFCLWGSSLGLPVMYMTCEKDSDDDDMRESETVSHTVLAEPYAYSKPWRKLRVLSTDSQQQTVGDWRSTIEYLPGIEGHLEDRLCSKWEIQDLLRESIYPGDAGVLFVDILLSQLCPDFYAHAHRAARECAAAYEELRESGARFIPELITYKFGTDAARRAAEKAAAQADAARFATHKAAAEAKRVVAQKGTDEALRLADDATTTTH
jgi:hypothetical protein